MTLSRIALCALISISANTYAETQGDSKDNSQGNITAGQTKSATCQGCHGPDGNSFSPDWPNLARQNTHFLAKQIHDFQSGARKDPTMSSMVLGLGEQDIRDIAAYFSAQTVNADPASQSSAGKKLYAGGNSYSHVPACAGCHGPNGVGNGPGGIPRLAGQKPGYVAKALRDFKTGVRSNDRNQIMRDIAAKMTEKEIDAMALFLAGMGAETAAAKK
jgi:cytochrome c553